MCTAQQNNSSIVFGDRFILKLFRKLDPGVNPEFESGVFLKEHGFRHSPVVTGHLEYRREGSEPMYVGILHAYVPNQGDAWNFTLDSLSRFFEQALANTGLAKTLSGKTAHPIELMREEPPAEIHELMGTYLESARLLGERTAQMHTALADPDGGPDFAPEPFTDHYRLGVYHGLLSQTGRLLEFLHDKLALLSEPAAIDARRVLENQDRVRALIRPLRDQRIQAMRIRQHGDFHLGQVLYTGKDFVIIDFEGQPERPLTERRLKKSALRDVASMIRSFQYAAYAALFGKIAGITARPDLAPLLESLAAFWSEWVSATYLKSYFHMAGDRSFIPGTAAERRLLLDVFLLEKALQEVHYDLMNRPDWARIPLRGIVKLVLDDPT